MASHGRALSPNLRVQLALGGEYSQLSQIGGGADPDLLAAQGTLSAAWKPNPLTDVNLRLQRRVGQLNFFDFLASVNLGDDRENAGNPSCRRRAGKRKPRSSATSLGLDDAPDLFPPDRRHRRHRPDRRTGESPGNIARAIRYGAEWKGTVNFDPAGWRGARLDARLQVQNARRRPADRQPRRISNSLMHLVELTLHGMTCPRPTGPGAAACPMRSPRATIG